MFARDIPDVFNTLLGLGKDEVAAVQYWWEQAAKDCGRRPRDLTRDLAAGWLSANAKALKANGRWAEARDALAQVLRVLGRARRGGKASAVKSQTGKRSGSEGNEVNPPTSARREKEMTGGAGVTKGALVLNVARPVAPRNGGKGRVVYAKDGKVKTGDPASGSARFGEGFAAHRAAWADVGNHFLDALKRRGYAQRTVECYGGWARRFYSVAGNRPPEVLGKVEVEDFLNGAGCVRKMERTTNQISREGRLRFADFKMRRFLRRRTLFGAL